MKKSKNNWKQNNKILSLFLLENKNQIQKKKLKEKKAYVQAKMSITKTYWKINTY